MRRYFIDSIKYYKRVTLVTPRILRRPLLLSNTVHDGFSLQFEDTGEELSLEGLQSVFFAERGNRCVVETDTYSMVLCALD